VLLLGIAALFVGDLVREFTPNRALPALVLLTAFAGLLARTGSVARRESHRAREWARGRLEASEVPRRG
jgi:hypothetical protein